ncbi:rod shape-determining protein [Streptomyces parvulus]|uniref:rod shape-determining protein n=1 Tax=Streptomyces parvulus TaxID=146923 RepID=UPI001E41B4FA|nr:rod shape-determining protein [Streptomyces parvulus]MCC9153965.1 rod shape-determining protein [Streptomyces parvulus]MCE7689827.1 rod shape-determining protein [Streptomyces parvulus]
MTVLRPRRAVPGRALPWPAGRRCAAVALDLGSARTRAWAVGRGLILDVPTVTFPGTGASYPVQRGAIVDVRGTARMLDRLLGHRMPRFTRPLVVLTAPVLDGYAYRNAARTAVEVLRPRGVVTVPAARAVALAAGADLSAPQLVLDLGAHLTEVVLLVDGAVFDARRTALGTADVDDATPAVRIAEAVADMTASMLRQDGTSLTADALARGPLLAGGGALRPDITRHLAYAGPRTVPSPHTAAVRGAALLLQASRSRPRPRPRPADPGPAGDRGD